MAPLLSALSAYNGNIRAASSSSGGGPSGLPNNWPSSAGPQTGWTQGSDYFGGAGGEYCNWPGWYLDFSNTFTAVSANSPDGLTKSLDHKRNRFLTGYSETGWWLLKTDGFSNDLKTNYNGAADFYDADTTAQSTRYYPSGIGSGAGQLLQPAQYGRTATIGYYGNNDPVYVFAGSTGHKNFYFFDPTTGAYHGIVSGSTSTLSEFSASCWDGQYLLVMSFGTYDLLEAWQLPSNPSSLSMTQVCAWNLNGNSISTLSQGLSCNYGMAYAGKKGNGKKVIIITGNGATAGGCWELELDDISGWNGSTSTGATNKFAVENRGQTLPAYFESYIDPTTAASGPNYSLGIDYFNLNLLSGGYSPTSSGHTTVYEHV